MTYAVPPPRLSPMSICVGKRFAPQTVKYVTHGWRQLRLRFDHQHANSRKWEENLSEPENQESARN